MDHLFLEIYFPALRRADCILNVLIGGVIRFIDTFFRFSE
jgi:hypothetical protein